MNRDCETPSTSIFRADISMAVAVVLVNCSHGPRYQLRAKQMHFKVQGFYAPPCTVKVHSEWGQESVCASVCVCVFSAGCVFLYQVGICRVQSKPRPGYFYMSLSGKRDLDFLFHYGCFYISGRWMSTDSLTSVNPRAPQR